MQQTTHVEDSKFNIVNKFAASSSDGGRYGGGVVAATITNRPRQNNSSPIRNGGNQQEQTPKVQYLGPNCLLIVYNEKDVALLLDEHFTKSLSGGGSNVEHRNIHRSFPPSFWNRHYYRNFRSSFASSSSSLTGGGAAGGLGHNHHHHQPASSAASSLHYYSDPYSSLLRSSGTSIWSQGAVAGPGPSTSRDFADVYSTYASGLQQAAAGDHAAASRLHSAAAAADAAGHHHHHHHSTYNQLLSLGRSAATGAIQAPPQYSSIRADWPVFPVSTTDYSQTSYPFQTGVESNVNHNSGVHSETQLKEAPFWFPVA